jgi:hypothetical protein
LMQFTTRRLSSFWSQALKKSACMADAPPEESVILQRVVGMRIDEC